MAEVKTLNVVTLDKLSKYHVKAKELFAAKATTLAGYGIADAYTKTEVDDLLTAKGNDITALQTRVGMDDTSGLSLRIKTNEDGIAANKAAIEVLNGEANVEGSVKKQVADAVAGVVANAPEDLDTLKEIADYIASDKTNAAEINNKISAIETKLATVEEGAEVNQNAYSNVKVGEVTLAAAAKTDTIEFVAGDNVTLAAADGKVTITAKDTVEASGIGMTGYVKGASEAVAITDTVLSAIGKLEGQIDKVAADSTAGFVSDVTVTGVTVAVTKNGSTVETTLPNATTTAAGVMSADDKAKLDGIIECTDEEINALFA